MSPRPLQAAGPAENSKEALRAEMRVRRRGWDPDGIRRAGEALTRQFLAGDFLRGKRLLGSYLATANEPPTAPLLQEAARQGLRLCVPCWDASGDRYRWAWWTADTPLHAGRWGLMEPAHPRFQPPPQPDIVLVPVLAVDLHGRRLGHGGGHFDRLLAATPAFRIALAYDLQIVPAVPTAPHDVPVDLLVTESASHDFRNKHPAAGEASMPPAIEGDA